MQLRKANITDINSIMKIIKEAQEYLKAKGVDQWQNNYPNVETIEQDIENNHSYVLINESEIVGTVAVSFDGENTYDTIYNGEWISNSEYGVIHRIAVGRNFKGSGISSEIIKNVERLCLNKGVHSIKVDTHEENLSMQKLLKENKFQYCGVIFLEDGSKRIAFEKRI